jgi:hypothetical protein
MAKSKSRNPIPPVTESQSPAPGEPAKPAVLGVTIRLHPLVALRVRNMAYVAGVECSQMGTWLIELGLARFQEQQGVQLSIINLMRATLDLKAQRDVVEAPKSQVDLPHIEG